MTDPVDSTLSTVVIGAGQAGFEVCAKLRELGMTGPITLIGSEQHAPYQRPPLSKAYLLGKMELARLFLRPLPFYDDVDITLKLGCDCVAIDREAKTVVLGDGTRVGYDRLVLATGASPIQLPDAIGGGLGRVHCMRSLADADALATRFVPGQHALIIGGGYIGLEAAAVGAGLGMKVTLVEASTRILKRVAATETAGYFRDLHKSHGVDIREGVTVLRLTGDTLVTGAELSDGSVLDVDVVVVGIGVRPNIDLAQAAGLEIENGIKVDAACITSDPAILAVGDCASFPHAGGRIRLESVGNAIDQGRAAAETITGAQTQYIVKPWFWSDQYDVKLQIVGLSQGYDRVVARACDDGKASYWYYAADQLIAVDAMNDPRAYMVAKRLIDNGKSVDPSLVSDPNVDVRSLLQRVRMDDFHAALPL